MFKFQYESNEEEKKKEKKKKEQEKERKHSKLTEKECWLDGLVCVKRKEALEHRLQKNNTRTLHNTNPGWIQGIWHFSRLPVRAS